MQNRWLVAAALVAATVAAHHGVLSNEFVDFDDMIVIVHNPNLADGFSADTIRRAFASSYGITANWIPLTALSLQLDHALFGADPAAFHAVNLALHALSVALLFFAATNLTGRLWPSAFVAAVFALHPVQVESVAWASERKGILCGVFFTATLLAYAHYAERGGFARYAAVLLGVACALLAKPMAVTLPFVLLLLDYWPLQRLGNGKDQPFPASDALGRALLEKLPMLALVGAASVVTLEVQRAAGATGFGETLGMDARVANALESVVAYLGAFFVPTDLAVFYPHPYAADVDSFLPAIGAAILVAGISAAAAVAWRTWPALGVGWAWFLGMLVPVSGLVSVGFAARADRYLYLPIIGLALAVAFGAAQLAGNDRRRRAALTATAALICVVLGVLTWQQTRHWRGTIPLFERAVAVTDGNFLAHHRLAVAKVFGGRPDEAEAHYVASIGSGPPRADVHAGYGDLLADAGRLAEAATQYERALALRPDDPRVHMKLGFVLLLDDRAAEARPHLERAQRQLGDSVELHVGLAMAAARTGDPGRAILHYRAALQQNPSLASATQQLAWILATSEDVRFLAGAEAIRLAESLVTTRRNARTLDTLAAAYASVGRFEDAERTAREAEAAAEQAGDPKLRDAIRERIAFYANGRPFIDWNARAIR